MVSHVQPSTNMLTRLEAGGGLATPVVKPALAAFDASPDADRRTCSEVLELLHEMGCDDQTMAATLWFFSACSDPASWRRSSGRCDPELVRLVDGLLSAEQVWKIYTERQRGSEGLRRLLLAIIHDPRVVFVVLARQLALLRHADALPADEACVLARMTADIHAPLANRLGIWQLKWELEDLTFRQLHPVEYHAIAKQLDERRIDRERFIAECVETLGKALAKAGIRADIVGRPKHIYSIWRKMQRKHLEFDGLYDIRALRVIVDTVSQCYGALGEVHALWPHLPKEFDDYIARPKGNGYRSLHTVVIGPSERTVEVQIRTREMHRINELGVAAHWRYKEGGAGDAAFEERIAWMRQLLDSRGDGDDDLFRDFRSELLEDRVYLLTPRGDVLDLPKGATVLDFAYRIHTEVGHRCQGAKVDGRIVPLTFEPASGARIEVITGKVSKPSRDWLSPQRGYLHTSRGREKVRTWFRHQERDTNLVAGRQILDREWKRLALGDVDMDALRGRLGVKTQDELLEALALGEITSGQLGRAVQQPERAPEPDRSTTNVADQGAQHAGALQVRGVGNLLTTLARCCRPVPGDTVRGFITRGRGVSVHRADCASLKRLAERDPDRVVDVDWGPVADRSYEVGIGIVADDRKNLQSDVIAVLSGMNTPIVTLSSRVDSRKGQLRMRLTLTVHDFGQLSDLIDKLASVPGVSDVRRLVA